MRKTITIGIVSIMVLMGFVALANPIAAVPSGTIDKSMDDTNLWLGDYIWITLDVTIAGGALTVYDDLPEYLSYIQGTFTVDGNPESPKINGGVSIKLDPGTYTIMFEVIFDSAPAENYWDENTAYLMDRDESIDEDSVDIWVRAYCGFHKYAINMEDEDGDGIIEVGEEVSWDFYITVRNINYPDGYIMYNVKIWDRFGAELEHHSGPDVTVGTAMIKTKGKSEKMFLTWTVGDLIVGQFERLDMEISTDKNPAGKQEYTSPGEYTMNSGAVLKFLNPDGIQLSAHTPSIELEVFEQDGLP